jgi:C-terminal processing protease CtpA/Prc
VPPQRVYGVDGSWAGGNEGVRPDIKVVNDPAKQFRGEDAQLEQTIKQVMQKVEKLGERTYPVFPSESETGEQ